MALTLCREFCAKQRVNWHVSKIIIAPIISALPKKKKILKKNEQDEGRREKTKPHGEIIMIDRLQSKTVVNEYLEMPSESWETTCKTRWRIRAEFELNNENIKKLDMAFIIGLHIGTCGMKTEVTAILCAQLNTHFRVMAIWFFIALVIDCFIHCHCLSIDAKIISHPVCEWISTENWR